MCKVILFGGTMEGRKLADYCAVHEIDAMVCVVSEYGAGLLPDSPWVKVCQGAKTEEEMEMLINREKPELVLDATHPYAAAVTENVRQACARKGAAYVRVARESQGEQTEKTGIQWVDSAPEAAGYLSSTEGNILLTTGSRELAAFSCIQDFERRVYARVLPDEKSIGMCRDMGLTGSHIIAMQGPFSVEMNRAVISMTEARYLVTKESGAAGGFLEKMEAAAETGIRAVVIGRPAKPEGITTAEAVKLLRPYGKTRKCRVFLVGIGMGGEGQMTGEAIACLERAQAVAGARRMMESASKWCRGKETLVSYKPDEIIPWLEEHSYIEEAAIVYSGDTGFYSGAKAMAERLAAYPDRYETVMIPGISTISCLCAKLNTSWEDVYMGSLHGRKVDAGDILKGHKRVFFLMEGRQSVYHLCRQLTKEGYGQVRISAGISLSYPEERIVTAAVEEMEKILETDSFEEGPCAVLLETVYSRKDGRET